MNAHYHGESFLLRQITHNLPFSAWPLSTARQRALSLLTAPGSSERVGDLYTVGAFSHLMSGTTCVGEYPHLLDADGFAAMRAGFEKSGIRFQTTLRSWEQIEAARQFRTEQRHAAIDLGEEEDYTLYRLEGLLRAAQDLECPLVAHVGEQRSGMEAMQRNFKKSPAAVLKEQGILAHGVQVLHANYFTRGDLSAMQTARGTVVLCGASAAAKRTGCPLLHRLISHDVRLAIGTDWGSTDVVGELQFLRRLPEIVSGVRPFSPLELIRMATINGAHALGCAQHLGSLERGKRADLVMFSLDDFRVPSPGPAPDANEIASLVVDHLGGNRISDVVVDGTFLVRDGAPASADRSVLRRTAQALQNDLRAAVKGTAVPRKAEGIRFVPTASDLFFQEQDTIPETVPTGINTRDAGKVEETQPPAPSTKRPKISRIFGEDEM